MSEVRWDGVSFSLPPSMIDQTVLTFVDKAQAVSVTMSQEPLAGGRPALLRYVSEQLADIARAVPGYTVISQGERSTGALPGIHVQASVTGAGKKRWQHQLYFLEDKRARVLIATVTAIDGNASKATELVDAIASSLIA